jgi:hypothetical protein
LSELPPWLIPTLLGVVITLLAYFLKKDRQAIDDRLAAIERTASQLREKVQSLDQEIYGAKGTNGMKKALADNDQELAFQGSVNHWMSNLIQVIANKCGVEVRGDKPKRSDIR